MFMPLVCKIQQLEFFNVGEWQKRNLHFIYSVALWLQISVRQSREECISWRPQFKAFRLFLLKKNKKEEESFLLFCFWPNFIMLLYSPMLFKIFVELFSFIPLLFKFYLPYEQKFVYGHFAVSSLLVLFLIQIFVRKPRLVLLIVCSYFCQEYKF